MGIKAKLYEIIFESDTKAGKLFDVLLLVVIVLSIILVMLESVPSIENQYHFLLKFLEWSITLIFSLEYCLRIWIVSKAKTYVFSFYGIIDFLSIIPSYLGLFIVGTHGLMVIRALRLLRIFRILKLNRYMNEGAIIVKALKQSRYKISVFLFAVLTMVVIIGTMMYLIEGAENGFTSIPRGIYWAIVTLTTVGYGDISPGTALGQFIASIVMILGLCNYSSTNRNCNGRIIETRLRAIPSGKVCENCLSEGHDIDDQFCRHCGSKME